VAEGRGIGAGDRMEREEERRKRWGVDMWVSPPPGVYISETTLQKRRMVKCEQF
jgi:hypothetical protein